MLDDAAALKQRMDVEADIAAHSRVMRSERGHGDTLPPRSALHELQRGAVLFSTASLVLAALLLLVDAGIVGVSSWVWAHAGPSGGGHGGDNGFRHTFLVVIVLAVLRIVLFIPLSRWAVKGRRSLLPVLCEIIGLGLLITKTVWLWRDTNGLQVQLGGDGALPERDQDQSVVLSDLYVWWDLLLLSIASSTAQIAWFVYRRAKGSIGGPAYTVLLDDLVLGGLGTDRSGDHRVVARTATTAGSAIPASDDDIQALVISEQAQTQMQAEEQEQPAHHRQRSGYHLSLRDLSLREGVAQIAGAWQLRVSEFRLRWRSKWSFLLERINAAALGEGAGGADGSSAAFHLLLRLYAHDDVSAELNGLAVSRPSEVRFYLPQLCSFLLHGSAEQQRADELEACLLQCARASPLFALRLHWFLQAFCRLAEFIQAEGVHRGAVTAAKSGRGRDPGTSDAGAGAGAIGAASLAVASTSAAAAAAAAAAPFVATVAPPPWLSDVCALMEAVQAQAGAEAHVGVKRGDAIAQPIGEQRVPPQPLQKTATASFWHTLQFVEKLTALTEVLMATPRKREIDTEIGAEGGGAIAASQGAATTPASPAPRWHSAKPRTDALRYALEELDATFVAQENENEHGNGGKDGGKRSDGGDQAGESSRTGRDTGSGGASCPLLLPMQVRGPSSETPASSPSRSFSVSISPARARSRGRARDLDPALSLSRIVRLHAAESLTFSTNEHVPFLVCCEVIDMDERRDENEPGDWGEGEGDGEGEAERNAAGRSWSSSVAGIKASVAQRFQQLRGRNTDSGTGAVSRRDGSDEEALDEPLLQQFDEDDSNVEEGGAEEAADQLAPLRSSTKQHSTHTSTGKPRSLSWAADSDGGQGGRNSMHRSSAPRASTFGSESARRRADTSLPWDGQRIHEGGNRPRSLSDEITHTHVVHASQHGADTNAPHALQPCADTATISATDADDVLVDVDQKSDDYGDSSDGDIGLTGRRARGGVVIFSELWRAKEDRVRANSKWGHCSGWRLVPLIVKGGDEFLRQEQLAGQLIAEFDRIFRAAREPLFLRPYAIVATSPDAGLIEAVPDTISLDALRQKTKYSSTLAHRQRLRQVFVSMFGSEGSAGFVRARDKFVESLAAYSIVCYLLQIKDRHNGNILLDSEGHLIHIDFGFLLGTSPGGNFGFEGAPFKLTDEWVELMDGPRSATFRHFRYLCVRAFVAARAQYHKVTLLVEMALVGSADLPCFTRHGPRQTVSELVRRFRPDITSQFELSRFVNGLIDQSLDSWSTKWYDKYQRCCVGVF